MIIIIILYCTPDEFLQAEMARKFMAFLPAQHARCGIITPFDVSFHPNIIETFIQEHEFSCQMRDPKAAEHMTRIINPVQTLMRETTVRPAHSCLMRACSDIPVSCEPVLTFLSHASLF